MVIPLLLVLVALIIVLLAGGWLGLQVRAPRFPPVSPGPAPRLLPLPADLPAPVQRFASAVFGARLPEVRSALVIGRARLAPTGLPLPSRFRFYYDAGRSSHYHEIQATWFSLPILHIHERNLEGHATLDLAMMGRVDNTPRTNRAAIQGYWAEVLAWLPAIPLTDPRVRWEAVDAATARLHLPGLEDAEAFTVRFDPGTGLLSEIETMRYRDESLPERRRWRNRFLAWDVVNGLHVPVRVQTQWDDDTPWATWEIEQIALNVDVTARLARVGGHIL